MSQTIFPAIRYRDADRALEFLQAAFAARLGDVDRDDAGAVRHSEVLIEGAVVFVAQRAAADPDPQPGTAQIYSLYLVVSDPDAHHARALAAGARIVREPNDTEYGSREYGLEDPEGHLWSFGTYDPSGPAA